MVRFKKEKKFSKDALRPKCSALIFISILKRKYGIFKALPINKKNLLNTEVYKSIFVYIFGYIKYLLLIAFPRLPKISVVFINNNNSLN
jgi:hypothetical protein